MAEQTIRLATTAVYDDIIDNLSDEQIEKLKVRLGLSVEKEVVGIATAKAKSKRTRK